MTKIPTIKTNPVKPIRLKDKAIGGDEYGTIMESSDDRDCSFCCYCNEAIYCSVFRACLNKIKSNQYYR